MAECTFRNLTPKQALALANWFDEQGEANFISWFQGPLSEYFRIDFDRKDYGLEITPSGDVIIHCKSWGKQK